MRGSGLELLPADRSDSNLDEELDAFPEIEAFDDRDSCKRLTAPVLSRAGEGGSGLVTSKSRGETLGIGSSVVSAGKCWSISRMLNSAGQGSIRRSTTDLNAAIACR